MFRETAGLKSQSALVRTMGLFWGWWSSLLPELHSGCHKDVMSRKQELTLCEICSARGGGPLIKRSVSQGSKVKCSCYCLHPGLQMSKYQHTHAHTLSVILTLREGSRSREGGGGSGGGGTPAGCIFVFGDHSDTLWGNSTLCWCSQGTFTDTLRGEKPSAFVLLLLVLPTSFAVLYIPEPERVLEEHVGFTHRQLMALTRHRLAHESPEPRSSGAGVHRRERRTGPGEKALKAPFIYIYF